MALNPLDEGADDLEREWAHRSRGYHDADVPPAAADAGAVAPMVGPVRLTEDLRAQARDVPPTALDDQPAPPASPRGPRPPAPPQGGPPGPSLAPPQGRPSGHPGWAVGPAAEAAARDVGGPDRSAWAALPARSGTAAPAQATAPRPGPGRPPYRPVSRDQAARTGAAALHRRGARPPTPSGPTGDGGGPGPTPAPAGAADQGRPDAAVSQMAGAGPTSGGGGAGDGGWGDQAASAAPAADVSASAGGAAQRPGSGPGQGGGGGPTHMAVSGTLTIRADGTGTLDGTAVGTVPRT